MFELFLLFSPFLLRHFSSYFPPILTFFLKYSTEQFFYICTFSIPIYIFSCPISSLIIRGIVFTEKKKLDPFFFFFLGCENTKGAFEFQGFFLLFLLLLPPLKRKNCFSHIKNFRFLPEIFLPESSASLLKS